MFLRWENNPWQRADERDWDGTNEMEKLISEMDGAWMVIVLGGSQWEWVCYMLLPSLFLGSWSRDQIRKSIPHLQRIKPIGISKFKSYLILWVNFLHTHWQQLLLTNMQISWALHSWLSSCYWSILHRRIKPIGIPKFKSYLILWVNFLHTHW